MMNVVAICLVLSSLAAAGVFSPHPQPERKNPREDMIVKEGHRLIMVEYEREGPLSHDVRETETGFSTYKPIEMEDKLSTDASGGVLESAKEKFKEASSVLPNLGQGLSPSTESNPPPHDQSSNAREIICDALGKCKHKIAGAFGKAKETVSDKTHLIEEKAKEAQEAVWDKAHQIEEKAKEAHETVWDKAHKIEDRAKEAGETVWDKAHLIKEKAQEARETVSDKANLMEDKAKEAGETVWDKAQLMKEKAKWAGETVSDKAHLQKEKAKEAVSDKAHLIKEKAQEARDTVSDEAHLIEDKAKEAGEAAMDKAQLMKEQAQEAGETVREKAHLIKEKAQEVGDTAAEDLAGTVKMAVKGRARPKQEERRNFTEILRRGGDVAYDAAMYAISPEMVGVVHLLGFAAAYGICVWVTFVSSHVLAGALPRQQFGMIQSKIYPVYFLAMAYCIGCSLLAHFWSQRQRFMSGPGDSSQAERLQCYNLLASLALVLVNLLYLEPLATKVMFERMKMEKEEGRRRDGVDMAVEPPVAGTTTSRSGGPSMLGATTGLTAASGSPSTAGRAAGEKEAMKSRMGKLNRRLKKLNTYSSFLNVMTLMALIWHLVYLSQRLQVTC